MTPHVLHVIQQLSSGGAGQALEALICSSEACTHEVASLIDATESARAKFRAKGIKLVEHPSAPQLAAIVNAADLVQIHFWNTPELYEFMATERSSRFLLWSHVEGSTTPHILIPELSTYVHALVRSCSPRQQGLLRSLVIAGRSPRTFRTRERSSLPNKACTVGIFGTLSSTRMCAEALSVFAQARLAGERLRVVGHGDLLPFWRQQAFELHLQHCVEFRGFVDDVAMELSQTDIVLYLPKPGSSVTADLALQEAMLAGAVPVVLAGTPVVSLVRHGIDALVGDDFTDCIAHLQSLMSNQDRLAQMSEAGQARARREFSARESARAFEQLYQQLCETPRMRRHLALDSTQGGARRFMATLADSAKPFCISASRAPGWQEADEEIASSPAALVGPGAGGILHYRGFYPKDPFLRYWAGLVLERSGRRALAAAEYVAAARGGVEGASDRLERCLHSPESGQASATDSDKY